MKKFQIKIEYHEEKIKAIKVSLKDKNKNFDEEIIKFIDSLYKKNVPKLLKKYIEEDFETEDKNKEEVVEEKNQQEMISNNGKNSSETLDNNTNKY